MTQTQKVKEANKFFYDLAAPLYNAIDGREAVPPDWLSAIVKDLAAQGGANRLLDLGAGSGLISKLGVKYFREVCAYDISSGMLSQIKDNRINKVAGSAEEVAFRDGVFNAVTCFSVLHHLSDHQAALKEVYRVLKQGGVFYSDHDIESAFRHKWIFRVLGRFYDSCKRYTKYDPKITRDLRDLAELHAEEGIDSGQIERICGDIGFRRIQVYHHWKIGLSGINNIFGKKRDYRRTQAPIVSFIAVK